MAEDHKLGGSGLVLGMTVVLLLLIVGSFLVLHFGQKQHNHLVLDLTATYPADRAVVPGEVFASTAIAIIEHELNGTTGWRPNDFILWGPRLWADNNANRQLGILQALRESLRVFKDHLTKVSSNEFDANLVAADTAVRNDAERLWLPSAESKHREAAQRLKDYIAGLKAEPPRSRVLNLRNVELIRLFQAWTDQLGDAHAILYREQSMWRTDDDFYRAQGAVHTIHHLIRAIGREYASEFERRLVIPELMAEVDVALARAATLKPIVVFDGGPDGVFANHRRNLDAYISEARQKMYSIREELEK